MRKIKMAKTMKQSRLAGSGGNKAINRILLFVIFIAGSMLYGQDLPRDTMNTGQFSQLSDAEKIEHVKRCFREGINVHLVFARQFAEAGGRDILPFLLEEMPKHEFYHDIYDQRLNFITNVLIYFRDNNVLTLYERYYIAQTLEAKIINYIKRAKRYDLLVKGINANIWMFLNPEYIGQLSSSELDEIILAKYRTMGLLE